VTFQRATTVTNEFNEQEPTWADLVTVWASKQDIRDAERIRAAQTGASVTARFQVRWNMMTAQVTVQDRLICEGRTYAIVATKELGRREGLEITASAEADG
jgi:SPP1 family predicted phage head-tail adaptor